MSKQDLPLIKFVESNDLVQKFSFINNEILRANVAIKMQHIVFLVSLEEEHELPGTITYSVFKTIIIYTASIIEGLLHYKLNELIKSGLINENQIMGFETKNKDKKEIYTISSSEKIYAATFFKKPKKLSAKTTFNDITSACKKIGLLDEGLYAKCEKVRETRNRIHPYGLDEIDDQYSKDEINETFEIASLIMDRIENFHPNEGN